MACSTKEKQLECQRRHYRKNKQYYLDRNKKKREELLLWFNTLKGNLKCNRCPVDHVATLQFHHLDPGKKENTVSQMVANNNSIKKIKEEIAKCEVLCANCHAIEHWQQKISVGRFTS